MATETNNGQKEVEKVKQGKQVKQEGQGVMKAQEEVDYQCQSHVRVKENLIK